MYVTLQLARSIALCAIVASSLVSLPADANKQLLQRVGVKSQGWAHHVVGSARLKQHRDKKAGAVTMEIGGGLVEEHSAHFSPELGTTYYTLSFGEGTKASFEPTVTVRASLDKQNTIKTVTVQEGTKSRRETLTTDSPLWQRIEGQLKLVDAPKTTVHHEEAMTLVRRLKRRAATDSPFEGNELNTSPLGQGRVLTWKPENSFHGSAVEIRLPGGKGFSGVGVKLIKKIKGQDKQVLMPEQFIDSPELALRLQLLADTVRSADWERTQAVAERNRPRGRVAMTLVGEKDPARAPIASQTLKLLPGLLDKLIDQKQLPADVLGKASIPVAGANVIAQLIQAPQLEWREYRTLVGSYESGDLTAVEMTRSWHQSEEGRGQARAATFKFGFEPIYRGGAISGFGELARNLVGTMVAAGQHAAQSERLPVTLEVADPNPTRRGGYSQTDLVKALEGAGFKRESRGNVHQDVFTLALSHEQASTDPASTTPANTGHSNPAGVIGQLGKMRLGKPGQ